MLVRLIVAALTLLGTSVFVLVPGSQLAFGGGSAAVAAAMPRVQVVDWLALPQPEQPAEVRVTLHDLNTLRQVDVALPADGNVGEQTADQLRVFFRCRRTLKSRRMHPGLLAILADIAKRYPGRVVEIMSAYRARPYGAPRSKHFIGRAVDLRVRGIRLTALRDYLWSRHAGTGVGVGWYPGSGFVHVDYRHGQPDAAWTQAHRHAKYRYRPRWSRRVVATAPR